MARKELKAASRQATEKGTGQRGVKPACGPPWNYHELVENAVGVISTWHAKQPAALRAKMDRHLDQLRPLPKSQWSRPKASPLKNNTYVIRFTDVTRKQIRVFGHFYDVHASFVMTFEGFEKDNVYHPENYKALALSNKARCDASFISGTQRFNHRCQICSNADALEAGKPSC